MSNLRQKLFESRNIAGISVVMPAMNISDHDRFLRRADEIRRFLYLGCVLIRTLFTKLDERQAVTVLLLDRIRRSRNRVLVNWMHVRASAEKQCGRETTPNQPNLEPSVNIEIKPAAQLRTQAGLPSSDFSLSVLGV